MALKNDYSFGRAFISAQEYSVLSKALRELSATPQYQALNDYYQQAGQTTDPVSLLTLASLFQEQLAVLLKRKKNLFRWLSMTLREGCNVICHGFRRPWKCCRGRPGRCRKSSISSGLAEAKSGSISAIT
ncbi:hypothetical protein [Pseudomonas siliginis]|uniref:hypothetical protein n=1 Tax=Pseudomonas siliginis TaxID=2842346 RepID=UPI002093F399|nr:hypothetical protein [Pseudomonas siliginis]UST90894.1 hypothetical protein NF678_02915 [Pseudomonas siliginis]